MPLYFLILDTDVFHQRIAPPLKEAWRRRSFAPCRDLCVSLMPAVRVSRERYQTAAEEPLLARVSDGLGFDRDLWRLLVGEALLYSATDVPDVPTSPATLARLLGCDAEPDFGQSREAWPIIHQAHLGSRDLVLGGFYRPERGGYHDADDVRRIAAYLGGVRDSDWEAASLADLVGPDAEDCEDELAFARECLAALTAVYVGASGRVIVCESV